LKKSTLGIAALVLLGKLKFYITRDQEFEHKVRLIFPQYNSHLGTDEGKIVKIVSENQLEHMIKLCNQHSKTVRS